jgi:hypothetical protein
MKAVSPLEQKKPQLINVTKHPKRLPEKEIDENIYIFFFD